MRSNDTTIAVRAAGRTAPDSPVPLPRAVTGTPVLVGHAQRRPATSSVDAGRTTNAGAPAHRRQRLVVACSRR